MSLFTIICKSSIMDEYSNHPVYLRSNRISLMTSTRWLVEIYNTEHPIASQDISFSISHLNTLKLNNYLQRSANIFNYENACQNLSSCHFLEKFVWLDMSMLLLWVLFAEETFDIILVCLLYWENHHTKKCLLNINSLRTLNNETFLGSLCYQTLLSNYIKNWFVFYFDSLAIQNMALAF